MELTVTQSWMAPDIYLLSKRWDLLPFPSDSMTALPLVISLKEWLAIIATSKPLLREGQSLIA